MQSNVITTSFSITREYSVSSSIQSYYIPGYKVKKVIVEQGGNLSSSDFFFKIYNHPTTSTADLGFNLRGTGDWGYTQSGYNGGSMKYGALYSDSNHTIFFDYPSSATSSTQGAIYCEITENLVVLKIGKVYGNWLYETSFEPNSTFKSSIKNVFESSNISGKYNSGFNGTVLKNKYTFTYTRV